MKLKPSDNLFHRSVALSATAKLMLGSEDINPYFGAVEDHSTKRTPFQTSYGKTCLQTLTMLLKTHLCKEMSTAISATLPLEEGPETDLSHSDRDNLPSLCLNLIPARAFEVLPNTLQTENQQQVSVHLFAGECDGKGLNCPELNGSVHLHTAVPFPAMKGAGKIHSFSCSPELSCSSRQSKETASLCH